MPSNPTSSQAIEQAISFLTTPLSRTTVSASAITILRSHLYASLTQLTQRSLQIGLRLASSAPPPECIARACDASGVNWSEWLFLIGGGMGLDLDINIQPNAVTASFSRAGTPSLGLVTVWQQEEPQLTSRELLYADDDSDDLFNEINRSQHSPSWLSSWSVQVAPSSTVPKPLALVAPVPVPRMQPVPVSARSHSRSSSYASSSSGSHHSSPSYHHANTSSANPTSGSPFAGYSMAQGVERTGSACSSHGSNASGSPPASIYSLSEDGSSGSSGGALSWTRRGTVIPGPQQSAILAARNAHAAMAQYPPVPTINIDAALVAQQQAQAQAQQHAQHQHHQRSSPSISSNASNASSTTSGSSNGHGKQHRRQRSTATNPGVVIDPSKASVTTYDGGKTKVMTGGVMLGSINSGKKKGY
jgi:hypothetical protein